MTLQIKIGGTLVPNVIEKSLKIRMRVDDKDVCNFEVFDATGTLFWKRGQSVEVSDTVLGKIFSGVVNKPTAKNLFPNPGQQWTIDCLNHFYVPKKRATSRGVNRYRYGRRYRGGKHRVQHTGTIAALQIKEYTEPSGITGNFGLDWTELQADWQSGTLSNVVAATNTTTGNDGAGNLELAPVGAQTILTGTSATMTIVNGLYLTGYSAQSGNALTNNYIYQQIWSGSLTVSDTRDYLSYAVWVSSDSAQIQAAVDFHFTDGTNLRDQGALDQLGLSSHPKTDLSGVATNAWYGRTINLPAGTVGKTINKVSVGFEGNANGAMYAWFQQIIYNMYNVGPTNFFGPADTLQTNVTLQVSNYKSVSLMQVRLSDDNPETVTHAALNISPASIIYNSQLAWTSTIPTGCSINTETSIDNQATWQSITSGNAVTNLLASMSVAGRSLYYRQTFTLGKDPSAGATLIANAPTLTINSSYASSKTDSVTSYTTSTDFNTGTFTNTQTILGTTGITLNGQNIIWANNPGILVSNQTTYGTGTVAMVNKLLTLTVNNNEVRSELFWAGSWQNFICECDVKVVDANTKGGIVYRSTGWQNNNHTYAYAVEFSTTAITLAKGTNSAIGTGTRTQLGTTALSLTANTVHRLKLVINGNSHQFYVDNILQLTVTDSTYPAAGNMGVRNWTTDVSNINVTFENFGVVAALSGTWQSPSINIAGPGTYGNSVISWDTDGIPNATCGISAQTSIDGGSTWQSVTNGGAISGLTAGQSLTGKTLLLLLTLTASNAPVVPIMNGVSAWIMGSYNATGYRTTAPLASDTANRLNVASGFGTSATGMTYTQNGTATTNLTSNELQILNTTGDVHMVAGSSTSTDEDAVTRFSLSISTISAGLELRYTDTNNFYRLSTSNTTITITKMLLGFSSTLQTTANALSTGTYYWMRFRVSGTYPVTLQGRIWADGTTEPTTWNITATD